MNTDQKVLTFVNKTGGMFGSKKSGLWFKKNW